MSEVAPKGWGATDLGDVSDFKAKSDMEKFDLAKKLKKKITDIRRENNDNLESNDVKQRQLATALYLIDKFALRVGNEKGSDKADTVGVSSLKYLSKHPFKLDSLLNIFSEKSA